MATRNQTIKATQFNSLQTRISQLLGNGYDDFGYGQAVSSDLVDPPTGLGETDANDITVDHINRLRTDLGKVYKHINGTAIPVGEYTSDDIIGADTSATSVTATPDPENEGEFDYEYSNEDPNKAFNNLVSLVSDAEVNRFLIASGEFELETGVIDERVTDWNNQIQSEFTVSFDTEDKRRHFFNSAGEIRFEGTVDLDSSSGNSLTRDISWKDMLENVGEIRFGYNFTSLGAGATANGVNFPNGSIGNYALDEDYLIIFKKDANSGDYSENYWQIEARDRSPSQIDFRISLIDENSENIIEPVTANLQFEYSYRRANQEIVAPVPVFNIFDSFE